MFVIFVEKTSALPPPLFYNSPVSGVCFTHTGICSIQGRWFLSSFSSLVFNFVTYEKNSRFWTWNIFQDLLADFPWHSLFPARELGDVLHKLIRSIIIFNKHELPELWTLGKSSALFLIIQELILYAESQGRWNYIQKEVSVGWRCEYWNVTVFILWKFPVSL